MLRVWLGLFLAVAGGHPAQAATYLVRPDGAGDFPTIQAAIDSAAATDVIELADGTFTGAGNRDISFLGKSIAVRSQSGDARLCVLDVQGSVSERHRGFLFSQGETHSTVLEGVEIRNGYAPNDGPYNASWGSAIYCRDGASPTITHCRFVACHASSGGAVGVYHQSHPEIQFCWFEGNVADGPGGGICCRWDCNVEMSDCVFLENSATLYGGAVALYVNSNSTLTRCVLSRNTAAGMGGGLFSSNACTVSQCTFSGNSSPTGSGIASYVTGAAIDHTIVAFGIQGAGVQCYQSTSPTLLCCDVYGNAGGDWVDCIATQYGANGNISLDPLLCDPDGDNYYLLPESPCATENNPECGQIGALPAGCVQSGVCCSPAGSCAVTMQVDCTSPSIWHPEWLSCEPNPCSQPDGACCLPFDCEIRKQADCVGTGWTWTMDGVCEPTPCPVSSVGDADLVTSVTLRNSSNPFTGTTTLRLSGPPATSARVLIFDAAGRLVRTAWEGNLDGREVAIAWDGKDQSGRETLAGIYLVRVESGAGEAVGRLVKTR
jgi:hypothetical protein